MSGDRLDDLLGMDFPFVPYGQQLGKVMAAMSVLNSMLGSESLTENAQASDTRAHVHQSNSSVVVLR